MKKQREGYNLDNIICLKGRIITNCKFNSQLYLYEAEIEIKRYSGVCDIITVFFREEKKLLNEFVEIAGEIISYQERKNGITGKKIGVIAGVVSEIDNEEYENIVFLSGIIFKEPILRNTAKEKLCCDVNIIVKRRYNRAKDLINCICWFKNAEILSYRNGYSKIEVLGRLQSRVINRNNSVKVIHEVAIKNIM